MFKIKKNFFLFLFFFLFSFKVLSSDYIKENSLQTNIKCKFNIYENLDYLLPNSEININIPNSSKWNRNLFSAFLENKSYIISKYKKKFNATIVLKDNLRNEFCSIPAKVRLSGDLLDHLDIVNKKNQPKASIDVKLKKGNIKNIITFKLFLPKTKQDENFVVFQSIMSELNFITPRVKYVDVKINKNDIEKYLFVEKPSKEMIEFNKKREGPIVAMDESLLWRKNDKRKDVYLAKLVNRKWASQNDITIQMSKEILDAISMIYLEYHQRYNIEKKNNIVDVNFGILEEAGYDISDIKRYNLALIAFNAQHGLQPNNRKYFFSPLNKKIYAVSNDENPNLNPYNDKIFKNNNFYLDYSLYDDFLEELNLLDKNKILKKIKIAGLSNFSEERLTDILEIAKNNLIFYKKKNIQTELPKSNFAKYFEKNKIFLNKKNYFSSYKEGKINLEVCDKELKNCKMLKTNNKNLSDIFANKIKNSKYITDKEIYESAKFKLQKLEGFKTTFFKNGKILYSNNIDLNLDEEKKLINVSQNQENARIVFQAIDLEDYQIKFKGIKSNEPIKTQIRITEDNLTGCINILDSRFKNTKIEVDNTTCEDALNIVDSKGSLDLIKVNNALYDGLDVDFSNLLFKSIIIKNSNNDCLDLSYGNYIIEEIRTEGCEDKSISIGEASRLKLVNFYNNNSKVGVAVKDSSIAWIEKMNSINSTYCVLAYRKKQEFSGGQVFLGQNNCSKDSIQVDSQSNIFSRQ